MSDTLDIVRQSLDQILSLGPEMLLFVGLLALGYVLKLLPFVANQWIPTVNFVVAVVAYPLLADPARAPFQIRYPVVRHVIIGLIIFAVSWLLHNQVLKRLEDRFVTSKP